MPQTLMPNATAHPVLVEVTETRLVWIAAETPEQARRLAPMYGKPAYRDRLPLVDANIETRTVTEELAYELDAAPEEYERLDDYFAATTGGRS
jgi:hypothetical protein